MKNLFPIALSYYIFFALTSVWGLYLQFFYSHFHGVVPEAILLFAMGISGVFSTYFRFSRQKVRGGNISLGVITLISIFLCWDRLMFYQPVTLFLTFAGVALCLTTFFSGSPRVAQNGTSASHDSSEKEFWPVFILCLLFGYLGVHRFYVGKTVSGVFMIFTLGGLGIWVIVDLVLLLIGNFDDSNGKFVKFASASANNASSGQSLSIADELEKFADLRAKGIITEEEFQAKKKALLGS